MVSRLSNRFQGTASVVVVGWVERTRVTEMRRALGVVSPEVEVAEGEWPGDRPDVRRMVGGRCSAASEPIQWVVGRRRCRVEVWPSPSASRQNAYPSVEILRVSQSVFRGCIHLQAMVSFPLIGKVACRRLSIYVAIVIAMAIWSVQPNWPQPRSPRSKFLHPPP